MFNPFSPKTPWQIGIKKKNKKRNSTLNGCISKANSESKVTFSESSFNFFQNRVVFCTLYPSGYTAGCSAPYNSVTAASSSGGGGGGAPRANDEPVKVLNLLFFIFFFWKWAETFEKLQFFTFGPKQCFYLTHSVPKYFAKLASKKTNKTLQL